MRRKKIPRLQGIQDTYDPGIVRGAGPTFFHNSKYAPDPTGLSKAVGRVCPVRM